MIKVNIFEKDKDILGFEIRGHSNSNDRDKNIICCSVSVISQGVILGLLEYLSLDVDYIKKEGYLTCTIKNYDSINSTLKIQIQTLMNTLIITLKNIQNNYPNNITIKMKKPFAFF